MLRQSSFNGRSKYLLIFIVCCDFLFSQCWSYVHTSQILLGDLRLEALSTANRQKLFSSKLKCLGRGTTDAGFQSKRLKVLCLHGYLSSSKYFQLQLRRLVDDAQDISDFGICNAYPISLPLMLSRSIVNLLTVMLLCNSFPRRTA